MELVYLWVEEYKNIKNQEFNFSPRFTCKYNEENNVLDIKPKEHIENFFGKNINVTAIVGENGSGKSSILEFIRFALKKDKHIKKYASLILFFDRKTQAMILLNLLEVEIFTFPSIEKIIYKDIKSFNKVLNQTIFPTFDYSSTYNMSDYVRHNNNDIIKRHFPMYPQKFTKIDLLKEERENIKRLLINYYIITQDGNWNIFEKFFQPSKVYIYINFRQLNPDNLIETKKDEANKLIETIKINFENNQHKEALTYINQLSQILSRIVHNKSIASLQSFNDLVNTDLILSDQLIKKNCFKNFKRDTIDGEFNSQKIFEWNIEELTIFEINTIVESFIQPYFTIEILDINQKKFNDLSFGEQQLLNILNGLYYFGSKEYIEQVTVIENDVEDISGIINPEIEIETDITLPIQNFVIFFDEIELGLHPHWQTNSIKYVFDFLSNIKNRNFHLVIASHSPFLLSDLPKENVIFLEKYTEKEIEENHLDQKVGNCKNATKDVDINPFGANIHTLLSHGFFMKDGLMGEFAKNKISKILNFLSGKNEFIDIPINQIKPIIEIIGEDFLREKLLKMYDEKFQIKSKDEEIKELKAEIERLKNAKNNS